MADDRHGFARMALHDLAETAQYPALECWSLVLVKQSDGFVACHAGDGGGGGVAAEFIVKLSGAFVGHWVDATLAKERK